MKILYCLHGTFNSGGMERIVINKANYLAQHGYYVIIVTTEQKNRVPFFSIHPCIECIDLGINYEDDVYKNFFKKLVSFRKKIKSHRFRLESLLIEKKADIVVSTFGNEVVFLPFLHDHSKKIVEIHFSKFFRKQLARKGIWKIVDYFRTCQDDRIISKYDKFVCLTNEDRQYWGYKSDRNNIMAIPNFINYYPVAKTDLVVKQVIAVGRLSYQKGYDRLIDAWKIVSHRFPEWKLRIFGSGELYSELSKQIQINRLEGHIEIQQPTSRIYEEYLKSSLFLLSSHYEGMPMVLLEAFSCGLPVVSFNCKCGPNDLIDDGVNGFLVEEGDVLAFADKIMKVLENEELRKQMGQEAYKTSLCYSEEIIMGKWISLFKGLYR